MLFLRLPIHSINVLTIYTLTSVCNLISASRKNTVHTQINVFPPVKCQTARSWCVGLFDLSFSMCFTSQL